MDIECPNLPAINLENTPIDLDISDQNISANNVNSEIIIIDVPNDENTQPPSNSHPVIKPNTIDLDNTALEPRLPLSQTTISNSQQGTPIKSQKGTPKLKGSISKDSHSKKPNFKYFKRSKLALPPKATISFDSHPGFITLLADFYKSSVLDPKLLSLLIQDQHLEKPQLLKQIAKKLFGSTKLPEDKLLEIELFLDNNCKRNNYGLVKIANINWHIYRWDVNVELLPQEFHNDIAQRQQERLKVQQEILEFYEQMSEEDRIEFGLSQNLDAEDPVTLENLNMTAIEAIINLEAETESKLTATESTPIKPLKEKKRKTKDTPKVEKVEKLKSAKKPKVEKSQPTLAGFFKPVVKKELQPVVNSATKLAFQPFTLKPGVVMGVQNIFHQQIPNMDGFMETLNTLEGDQGLHID